MERKPILTIAIPTYNGAKTIANMFHSLLPQCNDEVEVIVSNNKSTDTTADIIGECIKRFPFVKVITNEVNIGPDANFLQCMKYATGRFVWLISDDDIVIEDAIVKVIDFLRQNSDLGLVYAQTVDFRGHYETLEKCQFHKPYIKEDIVTCDKKEFMKYASKYWGFMSSFICNTERMREILNPEQYYGTYWLQSYIHALCASGTTKLGVIKGPCIGAGVYMNTVAFDSAMVNGIFYKKMLDFMIDKCEFDKKQLNKLYINRLCLLSRHDIIKEKASGDRRLNISTLFRCTKGSIKAWVTVYPFLCIPDCVCAYVMLKYRKIKGVEGQVHVNREEDVENYKK